MREFCATHMIITETETFPVMLCDDGGGGGPAFTREEWDSEIAADWERSDEGEWTFQGRAVECSVDRVIAAAQG